MIPSPNIVKVDRNGMTAARDDITARASRKHTRLGYLINVPVLAEYPDGTLRQGNIVMVTPKGMEALKRMLPLNIRNARGTA